MSCLQSRRIEISLTRLSIDVLSLEVPRLEQGQGKNTVAWVVAEGGEELSALVFRRRLEGFPERGLLAEIDLAQGQEHLADAVVPRESIVVEDVQVQDPRLQLLYREALEVERLVPSWIERAPLDLRLEPVLLVREQRHAHVRVRSARQVLRRQLLALQNTGRDLIKTRPSIPFRR